MGQMKIRHSFFNIAFYLCFMAIIFVFLLLVINISMYLETKSSIHPISSFTSESEKKEYAIVLGASVHGIRLSGVLRDRVNAAIALYKKGLVKKILMSGDGLEPNYNEPNAMKRYAILKGVPAHAIYTDMHGFNTFESIIRSKIKFNIKDAYIISQTFHVGRAVWLAKNLDIDVNGVTVGKFKPNYYLFREIFARFKDFWHLMFRHYMELII